MVNDSKVFNQNYVLIQKTDAFAYTCETLYTGMLSLSLN